jgi:hypothetical protein
MSMYSSMVGTVRYVSATVCECVVESALGSRNSPQSVYNSQEDKTNFYGCNIACSMK